MRSDETKNLIRHPVRSNTCRHFNKVMELEELLQKVQQGEPWRCLICKKPCYPQQLYADAFVFYCLEAGAHCSQVSVTKD